MSSNDHLSFRDTAREIAHKHAPFCGNADCDNGAAAARGHTAACDALAADIETALHGCLAERTALPDVAVAFVADCLEPMPDDSVGVGAMYRAFGAWCAANAIACPSMVWLRSALGRQGFEHGRPPFQDKIVWRNVRLRADRPGNGVAA